jgi:hypothetical protein
MLEQDFKHLFHSTGNCKHLEQERSQENSINLRVPELHKKDMFGVKGDGGGLYRRR